MRKTRPVKEGKQFELDIAYRTGMTRIPCSGSGVEKEDLIDDVWLAQAKATKAQSRSFKLEEWDELAFHALQRGLLPRMEFRLAGRDFVILSYEVFDRIDDVFKYHKD